MPFENIVGGEAGIGQGFALAQKRLGPGRIHHAMRWLGQSRRAFDMLCERALTRYTHGSILAEKQMIQDWIAESYAEMQAARLLTLQAAWKMDQLHAAGKHYSDARVEIGVIKFWGAQGALQRDRPGHPDPRLARLHHRPAARVDVPRRPGRPHLRRPRRGAQGHRRPPDPEGLRASDPPIEHMPTRRAAALEKFAGYLDEWRSAVAAVTSTTWSGGHFGAAAVGPVKVPVTSAVASVASSMAARMSSPSHPTTDSSG